MAAPSSTFPDTNRIREQARDDLANLLDSLAGRKDLVLDADLMQPLDRVAGASLLKQHGVDKIFKLDSKLKSIAGCDQRIYLVHPEMTTMKFIADQINTEKGKGDNRKYLLVMVPRKLHVCEAILEQEGVHGDVTLAEYQMDLIPLDRDILSLELPEFFRSFYLDYDQMWLHTVARSLVRIQKLMGEFPNVYILGRCAKMTFDLMNTMIGERLSEPDYSNYEIGNLILIDRDVDFVTPMCSQLTYEGLLDDTFGIHSGFIEFAPDITGRDQNVKVLLTSQDPIFEETRNRHFSNVSGFLSTKAKDLQAGFNKRHDLKSVGDMKDFVANDLKNLKQHKSMLTYHIGACEAILKKKTKGDFEEYLQTEHSLLEGTDVRENMNFIEELINKQANLMQTLKLLCLLSLTSDGIPSREFKSLKTQFLHSHGFDYMTSLFNLKKLGMLTDQEGPALVSTPKPLTKVAAGVAAMTKQSSFKALKKKLNLVPKSDDVNLRSPNDMSYVFSGAYSPLSCKLVEQLLMREGFVGLEEVIRSLPSNCMTYANVRVKLNKGSPGKGGNPVNKSIPSAARVVLVYFLGGCTYSEIAALRFLGRLKGYRFLIATTAVINGNSLLNCIMD